MVDSVQIVLFGMASGVGTDAVSQEMLSFLHALRGIGSGRHPPLVPFTASHDAGGCRRGQLRRCRRQRMPAARIPAAGILCRSCQLLP